MRALNERSVQVRLVVFSQSRATLGGAMSTPTAS